MNSVLALSIFGVDWLFLKPFIVIGLAFGGVYALSGVGLVVLYRATGVLNIAFGADGAERDVQHPGGPVQHDQSDAGERVHASERQADHDERLEEQPVHAEDTQREHAIHRSLRTP